MEKIDVDSLACVLTDEIMSEHCTLCESRKKRGRMCSMCRDDALKIMHDDGGPHAKKR